MTTPRPFQSLDEFIAKEVRDGSFPGAGIIVTGHGGRVLERSWGSYCSQTQRLLPLDSSVSHMLYSFSKGISATVIAVAHQQGLVDYDAPVSAYIPEYRGGWKDGTTIRHLLTHAAGIPRVPLADVYTDESWRLGVAACCAAPVEWQPGSKTEYHGLSGLFLAAACVRRVMRMASWEEICREFLFAPLGAASLTFRVPADPRLALTPQPSDLPCPIDTSRFSLLGHPGGGCFGRLEDVVKVLELHLRQGWHGGQQILRPEEAEEMRRVQYEEQIAQAQRSGKQPVHEPWGLGWLIRRDLADHWFGFGQSTCQRAFGHAGIDTVLGVADPERQVAAVFVTTNSPQPSGANVVRIRNRVTDLVIEGT